MFSSGAVHVQHPSAHPRPGALAFGDVGIDAGARRRRTAHQAVGEAETAEHHRLDRGEIGFGVQPVERGCIGRNIGEIAEIAEQAAERAAARAERALQCAAVTRWFGVSAAPVGVKFAVTASTMSFGVRKQQLIVEDQGVLDGDAVVGGAAGGRKDGELLRRRDQALDRRQHGAGKRGRAGHVDPVRRAVGHIDGEDAIRDLDEIAGQRRGDRREADTARCERADIVEQSRAPRSTIEPALNRAPAKLLNRLVPAPSVTLPVTVPELLTVSLPMPPVMARPLRLERGGAEIVNTLAAPR